MILVDRDEPIITGMARKVTAFMESLTAGVEPPRDDWSDPTVEALRWKYPQVIEEPPVEVPDEIGDEWVAAYRNEKIAKAWVKQARANLIEFMGDAKQAEYRGQVIAARKNGAPPSLVKAKGTDILGKDA